MLTGAYGRLTPRAAFSDFFWAWRALVGGLLQTLESPLPEARVYHAISTGYAGLMAARANAQTGRPAIVTEHGIYTNERRMEVLMAPWIRDTIDRGYALDDDRLDVRELWLLGFEAFARICYAHCRRVTTLYEDNQRLQRAFGALEDRLQVIANGVRLERFQALAAPDSAPRPPTVALIGRVAPIKDVKSFIAAVARVRERVPKLRALVLGPTDEDPAYARECRSLVDELGLAETLEFTGKVDVGAYLPQIDVIALTSISEAQPLVLLEAGAAGVPCVTTNVGSCREIIEGRSDEDPRIGQAGHVVELMNIDALAEAIARLLSDADERVLFGRRLQQRVETNYRSEQSAQKYRALYAEAMAEGRGDRETVDGAG